MRECSLLTFSGDPPASLLSGEYRFPPRLMAIMRLLKTAPVGTALLGATFMRVGTHMNTNVYMAPSLKDWTAPTFMREGERLTALPRWVSYFFEGSLKTWLADPHAHLQPCLSCSSTLSSPPSPPDP